jgi:glycosyltransferase involved in cell wall biosynthesis
MFDVICFSHLRWNFVYQRPQHLMSRLGRHFRVFFIEEPIYGAEKEFLENTPGKEGVLIVIPHLTSSHTERNTNETMQGLLLDFFIDQKIKNYLFWYYTPMALAMTYSFNPLLTIYDCMDELSAFRFASPLLKEREKELMQKADIVFTGGYSLYEAKRDLHPCVFPFPSSIDKSHFEKARSIIPDPPDQIDIPHPRIGFFGVVDERMDVELLGTMANRKPDWNFIIIGPVVKIDPAILPLSSNIHYLGSKSYDELPGYLGGWDVAMMPFAINESTRYISPTKTPEYLAGGKPVVSTAIEDVINPYEEKGLVYIARTTDEFVQAIEKELTMDNKEAWLKAVDHFLSTISWDITAEKMIFQINAKLETNQRTKTIQKEDEYV